jgi:hypothetical protein
MKDQDYTTTFTVDQTPEEVFAAISNVRGWWSEEIEGDTDKLDAIFYHHHKDMHRATFKIAEFEPGKKIVWHLLQNYFDFAKNTAELTDTDVVFEITKNGDKTELRFTHVGLNPTEECYGVCRDAWGFYIRTSLHNLIVKGAGAPDKKDTISKNNPVQK